ncbi:MAG: hypothetical protein ACE14M_15970 [Terriglobales bacterium]
MSDNLQFPTRAAKQQKYVVRLTAMVDVSTEMVVEAEDPEQARYVALRRAQRDRLKWQPQDTPPRLLDIAGVEKAA